VGNDTLRGGAGTDTYFVDSEYDQLQETANEGMDTVQSSVSCSLDTNLEILILTGSADLNGKGGALDNIIFGNNGNNLLDGGSGSDTLIGSFGNDTYIVDDINDVVIEGAIAGTDTVFSTVTWLLGANLENLYLNQSAEINGIGNALNNTITGNNGNNTPWTAGREVIPSWVVQVTTPILWTTLTTL
jgi:Ca2+-binding RTX toxin-like protein